MDRPPKPVPRLTPDNRPFWESCRAHRMLLPWCPHCERPHWPPGPVCPYCFGEELTWRPSFEADIPYNAVQVELEEGVRLTGNLVGAGNEALRVGLPVEVVFDDVT